MLHSICETEKDRYKQMASACSILFVQQMTSFTTTTFLICCGKTFSRSFLFKELPIILILC